MDERGELLKRAERRFFATGPRDCGQSLCVANMKYGLAKIHSLQQQLGLPADATFIGAPDMTVTRNVNRWNSGFGYGGKLTWGDGAYSTLGHLLVGIVLPRTRRHNPRSSLFEDSWANWTTGRY